VTFLGRVTGVFVMFAGSGIIGAPAAADTPSAALPGADAAALGATGEELAHLRAEIAALRVSFPADVL